MSTMQEHPSHHSFAKNITRPKEDALLNDAEFLDAEDEFMPQTGAYFNEYQLDPTKVVLQEELRAAKASEDLTGPMGHRFEVFYAQADIDLDTAAANEEAMGLDVAGQSYEKAMQGYLNALMSRPAYAPEPDYTFYLKLAGAQARLATWSGLEPYKTVMPEEQQKELKKEDKQAAEQAVSRPSYNRGLDRRKDLFSSAEDGYELALARAGGTEASPEALVKIFSERANMYALQAEYRQDHGQNRESQNEFIQALNNIANAKRVIKYTGAHEVDHKLAQRIDEQDSEVHDALLGKRTTELHIIAAESLRELAAKS